MPIKARIDMLSTGIRTPVGVKVIGTDLVEIDRLARQIEQVLRTVPGTSSAYAERAIGGYYLEIVPDRAALARYGIMVQDVQDTIATRARRTERDDDGGGPATLHRQHALSARSPGQSREDRKRHPGADAGRRRGAARRGRHRSAGARPDDDPHRKRAACDLHLCRHPRPRSRRLCRRCPACGAGEHPVSARLLRDVERAVRISGAGDGAAEDRGAGDAR